MNLAPIPLDKGQLVEMGNCRLPHGIRGEFTFTLFNKDFDDSCLVKNTQIIIFPLDDASNISSDGEIHIIENIRFGNKVIVQIKNISDRNMVEAMIPFSIYIRPQQLNKIKEDDTYYTRDLYGLKVIDFNTKQLIGEVVGTYENGIQTVLEIKTQKGNFEIPFVKIFVPLVDLENKQLEIIMPEYIEDK